MRQLLSRRALSLSNIFSKKMKDCVVHHIEFGVRNGEQFQRRLAKQYNFTVAATRVKPYLKQWMLQSGRATVVVTQPNDSANVIDTDPYFSPWGWNNKKESRENVFKFDSVFNVALKVGDLRVCVDKLTKLGVEILKPPTVFKDNYGEVKLAVVKSCIGNVTHTLVQDEGYQGVFLPGFEQELPDGQTQGDTVNTIRHSPSIKQSPSVTHFDHVTFACDCGDSTRVIDWYSKCFGMRRFLINREESEQDGFVIDTEDIGLRLKAFEYWKCAETGITSGRKPESIKFVVAEALPDQGPNQVETFLTDHGGPGIQHVGLHTTDIISVVADMKDNGVEFAEPPYTYYTEVGKLTEICDIGQDVQVLRENGILVDAEADPGEITDDPLPPMDHRYLMQKFTKPLFDKNTFFLEIIQRVGARGFGSGNITALWRSVQAYMSSKARGESS